MSGDPIRAALERLVEAAERVADVDPIAALDLAAALADLDAARAALAAAPEGDAVPIPLNADMAAGMVLLGDAYLREHAPERLRPAAPPAPVEGEVGEVNPPVELVEEWLREAHDQPPGPDVRVIAERAAQWGAAQSLRRPAAPLKPVAYIHRQGKHWEVSERLLQDDERARGWTEEPLYAAPPAPLEGEVADEARYLARELRDQADDLSPSLELFDLITRAAALLQQLSAAAPAVVPVAVSDSPGPEDCDGEGRRWWFCFECPGEHSYWILAKEVYCNPTYWLPVHAIPLPAPQGGEVE